MLSECPEVVGPNLTSQAKVQRRPPWELLFRAALWPTVVAAGIWAAVYIGHGQLQSSLARLRIEVGQPSQVEARYHELQMQLTQIEQRARRISELGQKLQGYNWKGVLETIRICVPDQLWLTRVRFTGEGRLTLNGAADNESLIYQFRKDLEAASVFDSATITTTVASQQLNHIVTEFSLECRMAAKAPLPDAPAP